MVGVIGQERAGRTAAARSLNNSLSDDINPVDISQSFQVKFPSLSRSQGNASNNAVEDAYSSTIEHSLWSISATDRHPTHSLPGTPGLQANLAVAEHRQAEIDRSNS